MPAVITHDVFGKEVYDSLHSFIGDSREECDAFLLGCQGPDIFFFGQLNPSLVRAWGIGTDMHKMDPNELLLAYRDAITAVSEDAQSVARAYVLGMLCHYLLDTSLHPFIYSQQYALCNAGVEGLDERDGHEVHAEIESELDVLVLSAKQGTTIAKFEPSKKILRGDAATLRIIGLVSQQAVLNALGKNIPAEAFERSVRSYRRTLRGMYSPFGVKREVIGRAEKVFRRHSFVRAMSHKNEMRFNSDFDNRDHAPWTDPGTGDVRTESFWDLYDEALDQAKDLIPRFWVLSRRALEDTTEGLDFDGNPVVARITKVETIDE